MRLEGKRIAITGAGSGLGLALAREAAMRGADLLLVGRDGATLARARSSVSRPHHAAVCAADVTTAAGRAAIASAIDKALGGLDILVNNAGVQGFGPLEGQDDAAIEAMLATNLAAPIILTRDLLPRLRASAPSRVVNVGSMFGDIAFPLFVAYSASKFGLRGASDALRRELADDGIAVTHVAPRAIRTTAYEDQAVLEKPFAMTVDTPEAVARRIWNGVSAGRATIYPGVAERLILLVQRLAPHIVDAALASKLRRARKALADVSRS